MNRVVLCLILSLLCIPPITGCSGDTRDSKLSPTVETERVEEALVEAGQSRMFNK
ncbi:MAG: hypothetical protein JXR76_10170 [Deltaproteobacteria bacterium]|nr:hypothetical protein [Deltaproteobacteria bacterium]